MSRLHTLEVCPEYKFKEISLTIQGRSVAADRTGFWIKEINVFLDAGINTYKTPEIILISHIHTDHCYNFPMIITGQAKLPKIYLPKQSLDKSKLFLSSVCNLSDFQYNQEILIGVSNDEKIKYSNKNRDFIIETIELDHSVPAVGYLLSESRRKLRSKYEGLEAAEIKRLKGSGIDICEKIQVKLLAYICDTYITGITDKIFEYPVIMVECTVIFEKDRKIAKKCQHIYWPDLEQRINNRNNIFCLFHFSKRYSDKEIIDFFKNKKQRLIIWLDSGVVPINI